MAFLHEQLVSVTGELRRRQSFFVGFTLLQKQEAKARKWENAKYGMVTACVGGGQGVAGIYEFLN